MTYLLFHGRHITHTAFQERYLEEVLIADLEALAFAGAPLRASGRIDHIVFAVTSANQSNSRFNPLPFYLRSIAIDRFVRPLAERFGVRFRIVPVPHFDPTSRYVDLLLKEVKESSGLALTPANTVVLASTPSLIELYGVQGFSVLTAEYDIGEERYRVGTPTDVVRALAETSDWRADMPLARVVARSTTGFWKDYPEVPELIRSIWKEPLLTESGSLTKTRNYSTYAAGMGHTELLDLKYKDISAAILPGRIVDEGCADGALLTRIAQDFPDSDLIGIEITSEFLARCHERQRAGEFGGAFVFFHQRNLMDPIFEEASIDTAICNSTLHEVWSYGKGEESLKRYLELKYKQLRTGGRLVIRDVIGPEDREKEVYMRLTREDGSNEGIFATPEDLAAHLFALSTEARFYRFAQEYLREMRESGRRGRETQVRFREEVVAGIKYFVLRLKDAVEFMTKKDYFDNFLSEMNEEFSFYSMSDWRKALVETGFQWIDDEHDSPIVSHAYQNPWIIENRFKGKVELFEMQGSSLKPIDYPPTNMVIIAEK